MIKNVKMNVHIDYHQPMKPHHKVVARLVNRYSHRKPYVIDIGCGVGHTLKLIKELLPSAILVAADTDASCLRITEKRVKLEQKILIKNIEELFEKENFFDTVIMSHVLEHMLRPVDIVISLMRMLKPGGILVLAVPNPVRPRVFLSALMKRHYVNRGHVCAWDRSHWINFLENILSLDVICYSQDFVELPFLRKFHIFSRLEEWLSKILPWLSFSNIAVVKKQEDESYQ